MNIFLILICLFLTSAGIGLQVKERFKGGNFNRNIKCRVLSFAPPQQNVAKSLNVLFRRMNDFFTEGFRHFNSCVIDDSIDEVDIGDLVNPVTGEYSGIIGKVQNDSYQGTVMPYNPSSRPFEPVKVGPVVMPSDMALITFRPKRKEESVQLEDFIYEFDKITYAYIALVIILVSIITSIIMYVRTWLRLGAGRKISLKKFVKKSLENLFNFLMLLINQILVRKINEANRIVWSAVVIFVFILIFNLFLSLIRSSYVVTRQPPYIEKFQDLVESKTVDPVTFKGIHYEKIFRNSENPSFQIVYKRLMAKVNDSFITSKFDFDPKVMERSEPIFGRIRDGKAAFIIDAVYVPFWKSGLCNFIEIGEKYQINASLLTRFTSTRELFAPGILTTMFSPKIDPFLFKYVHYYFVTTYEFALFKKLMHDSKYDRYFPDMMTQWNLTRCVDHNEKVVEDIDEHEQLGISNIRNFLIMMLRLCGLSLGTLIFEVTINALIQGGTWCRRKRKLKKFREVAPWKVVTNYK